jgi:hypothetical protein
MRNLTDYFGLRDCALTIADANVLVHTYYARLW